jgi:polyferredoxin
MPFLQLIRVARNLLSRNEFKRSEDGMLWTWFVILLFLWGIGLITSFTLSGFIHLLPLMAGVIALVGTLQRRQLTS